MDAIWAVIGIFLAHTWWLLLAILLGPLAANTWVAWRQRTWEHRMDYDFLEILIPREILKSPKAMEQVLAQLWSFKNSAGNLYEYWWLGELPIWHTFEMVSLGGQVHFYLRVVKFYRDLVEAAIFAFYPDIEIVEAEDYMKQFPSTVQELYRDNIKIWGGEMILKKSGAYPIKNYTDFESPDENKEYDPMSAFLELFGKIKPGQLVGVQYIFAPAGTPHGEHMIAEYQKEVIKLRERKQEEDPAGHGKASLKTSFPGGIMPALEVAAQEVDPSQVAVLRKAVLSRTPGETKTIEAIEENLARPIFDTMIRYLYLSPIEIYSEDLPRRALFGAFQQYGDADLNQFNRNKKVYTRGKVWEWPYIFPDVRKEYRRQRLWHDYRHREMPPHTFMGRLLLSYLPFNLYFGTETVHMSTRSLASIFHPPTRFVLTGPHVKRVDSRKGGAPAGMAIFGDEGQIEKFK